MCRCFGATDPGSGTAVMLEVIRIFGELRKTGWRPLRTIEFASWDGEEYNLIGSTEHVEGRLEDIRRNGLAYCTYLSEHPPVLIGTSTWGARPVARAGRSLLVEPVS